MPGDTKWVIIGWDTYAGESYWIPGEYDTEEEAIEAAKAYLIGMNDNTDPDQNPKDFARQLIHCFGSPSFV